PEQLVRPLKHSPEDHGDGCNTHDDLPRLDRSGAFAHQPAGAESAHDRADILPAKWNPRQSAYGGNAELLRVDEVLRQPEEKEVTGGVAEEPQRRVSPRLPSAQHFRELFEYARSFRRRRRSPAPRNVPPAWNPHEPG